MSHQNILILDFGSQFTQLIARRVRELGFYSTIKVGDTSLEEIQKDKPSAIILSGGPFSVFETEAPKLPEKFWEFQNTSKIPVLGICYGMQLMIHNLGGEVKSSNNREYGRQKVNFSNHALKEFLAEDNLDVWMSHGDEAVKIPKHFKQIGTSESNIPSAIVSTDQKLLGFQFHPEVAHTQKGIRFLDYFLGEFAELNSDWKMASVKDELIEKLRNEIPKDAHILCALSGGVDSTVAACLVHEAIGDRLHCCFVDHGLLRFDEQNRVMKMFQEELHLPVECVDDSKKFLRELKGVVDPEVKRKTIGRLFIETFDAYSKKLKEEKSIDIQYLVQGTLYPDVIESSPPPSSNQKFSATIKSHHNVGGLPEKMNLKLIEPLRDLFKDEVRQIGHELKVPRSFISRHPFPGPGLALRIIGEITADKIDVLQRADEVYISMLREKGLYDQIWQAFTVFLPVQSVGVQGDGRTYENVIALRAVTSSDGMTADWFPFEHADLAQISNRISNEVKGVNRVVYDVSSKPPATIEWE